MLCMAAALAEIAQPCTVLHCLLKVEEFMNAERVNYSSPFLRKVSSYNPKNGGAGQAHVSHTIGAHTAKTGGCNQTSISAFAGEVHGYMA